MKELTKTHINKLEFELLLNKKHLTINGSGAIAFTFLGHETTIKYSTKYITPKLLEIEVKEMYMSDDEIDNSNLKQLTILA